MNIAPSLQIPLQYPLQQILQQMLSNPAQLQAMIMQHQQLTPPDSSPESRSSVSSSSETPKRRKKTASSFCRICDKDISPPSGKKNQGPLRHVRQVHMNGERVYECKFCDFAAHYDKTHVVTHIRRHHPKEKACSQNVVDNSKSFENKTKELIGNCFKRVEETTPHSPPTTLQSPTTTTPLSFSINEIIGGEK